MLVSLTSLQKLQMLPSSDSSVKLQPRVAWAQFGITSSFSISNASWRRLFFSFLSVKLQALSQQLSEHGITLVPTETMRTALEHAVMQLKTC